jgi:hypothetical protein
MAEIMKPYDFSAVVDLGRDPILKLNSAEGGALIAHCKIGLAERAVCVMPGFVRDVPASSRFRSIAARASRVWS